jgi:dGTPase
MDEVLRGLVNWLVSSLLKGSLAAVAASGVANVDEVRQYPQRLACYTPEAAETNAQIKLALRREVYNSEMVSRERGRSAAKLAVLFEYFMQHPDAMPAGYIVNTSEQPRHRTVCDYIAGMTDGFLERTFDQLIGKQV